MSNQTRYMKTKFVLACKAFSRFCSHYNLVIWLMLYVLAFAVDILFIRMFRHKTKDMSARLMSRAPNIYS